MSKELTLVHGMETRIAHCNGVYDSYYNAYVYLPEDHCLFLHDYREIGEHGYGFISHPLSYSAFNKPTQKWILGITGDYLQSMIGIDAKPIQTLEGIKEKLEELVNKVVEVQDLYKQGLYTPPAFSDTTLRFISKLKSRNFIPKFTVEGVPVNE
jgi:hypothetical protein